MFSLLLLRNRQHTCGLCGVQFADTSGTTKLCKACREDTRRSRNANYKRHTKRRVRVKAPKRFVRKKRKETV